ncbi:beta-propeller domain-containing protein [Patescibacteria group bacterium]|nr:beta-propeller domain-containing protein [Patescibacteria group bacterium]MBU1703352.1 beta-propeller domain-containing protein [Patescibacteria group bacterium]MBU1954198.1 beta-propeller domain-containing protein [Patescibacteria group bacterium]
MKKTIILTLSAIGLFALAAAQVIALDAAQTSAQTDPFPDVYSSHVNYEAINYLKNNGIIEGYPDGNYKPENNINRAEFVKILMGAVFNYDPQKDSAGSGAYKTTGLTFSDIKAGEWYIPYLREAVEKNVISGYPDGTFHPEKEINFSEAAKIIANSYNLNAQEAAGERWYKNYVEALQDKKAIPLSVEYFDEDITRDEVAEMIWRLATDNETKTTRTYDEITGENFVTAASCAELTERFQEQSEYSIQVRGGIFDDMLLMEESTTSAPAMANEGSTGAAKSESAAPAEEYSTTNIQVAGVDEADIVKNDGKYIYLIKGDTVRIVEAYPAGNMKELVTITLGDENATFYPQEMYVDGDKLTIIGSMIRYYFEPMDSETTSIYPPYNYSGRTKAYILDISDRSKPTVERSVEIDGDYSTSRKVDNTLYLVINRYAYVPYWYYDSTYTKTGMEIVPTMLDSKTGKDELVAPCSQIRILPKNPDFNFLITAAIPLDDKNADVVRNVIVGNADNIYASRNNLYVTATDWNGGYYRDTWDTAVYRFGLGKNNIKFENKGKVPGTVLNQYSMDENNGYFRIATTKTDWSTSSQTTNNLYVLDTKDMSLKGSLENLAPGESIYSVRFMGDRAYMVTFRRVDPMFVIGLSNPAKPVVLGKLKLPGFSNYLHPYDENHIIGFGKEVDPGDTNMSDADFLLWQQIQGLKIGLFDVTDVNNPKEMFSTVIGANGTDSPLLSNPKALLFDKDKELLALPVSVYEYPDEGNCGDYTYSNCPQSSCLRICVPSSCTSENGITVCTADCNGENSCVQPSFQYGQKVFDGAYVYNLNLKDGFTLKGKIDHMDDQDRQDLADNGWSDYEKAIDRIIYIGENLYTISQFGVKANLLGDLAELKFIELAGNSTVNYY